MYFRIVLPLILHVHKGAIIVNRLIGVLSIVAFTALTGCSSTEVADKKSAFTQCVKENKGDEESCASSESANRTGLICKNVTVTGSRLPERVCTTKTQRDEQSRNSKMMVEGMQRRGQSSSNQ